MSIENKNNVLKKLRLGLTKTKNNINSQLENILKVHKKIDEDLIEEVEEILISADIGVNTTLEIIEYIREQSKKNKLSSSEDIKKIIKEYLLKILENSQAEKKEKDSTKVILVIGVNGVGKTTSIGKLAYKLKNEGSKVIVAAGDTFRAAAVEQLMEWCERASVDIIYNKEGSDPASVIYDSINAAKSRNCDMLICDTAGRLHNKKNLMNELNKIFRVLEKEYSKSNIEVLLVLDATTGQNGIIQAKMFMEACKIDGIMLTKLDGTAKGGIVIPVQKELGVPVRYIGIGENIDDLQDFNAEAFVNTIFS